MIIVLVVTNKMKRTILSVLLSLSSWSLLTVCASPLFHDHDWNGISGLNAWVKTVVADGDGNIYVGGGFTHAGSLEVNYIAKWDGSSWHDLAGGMNGYVRSLVLGQDGKLYAGGEFTQAGGNTTNYVAVWDGEQWASLGDGFDSLVFKLVGTPDGSIFAGGLFEFSGILEVNNIAKWNGSNWISLGAGLGRTSSSSSTYLLDMAIGKDGEIFVGGDFTTAGNISSYRVAKWENNRWHSIPYFFGRTVESMAVDPNTGNLYAYGYKFGMWDGEVWSLLPENSLIGGTMLDMEFDAIGNLFICGTISSLNGSPIGHILTWDGLNLRALGSGLGDSARALFIDNSSGTLYVGGYFLTAGQESADYIAMADISKVSTPFQYLDTLQAMSDDDADGTPMFMELIFGGNPEVSDTASAIKPSGFMAGEDILELDSSLPLDGDQKYALFKVIKRRGNSGVTTTLNVSDDLDFTSNDGLSVYEVGAATNMLIYQQHTFIVVPDSSIGGKSAFLRYDVDLSGLD